MFKIRALTLIATASVMPFAFSFANDGGSRVASQNAETAGSVVEYNIQMNDLSNAKNAILGVFDIFTEDDELEIEKVETEPFESPSPTASASQEESPQLKDFYDAIFSEASEGGSGIPIPKAKPLNEIVHESVVITEPPIPGARPMLIGEGPLAQEEAEIYKRIFALQSAGKMGDAEKEIARLGDLRLRGHVLYQRYMHPTSYVSSFDELRNWMALYSNHPGAKRVYNLALRKKPGGFSGHIDKPEKQRTIARRQDPTIYHGQTYRSPKRRSSAQKRAVRNFVRSIISLVNRERPTQAYKTLNESAAAKNLDTVEFDNLRARIAEGYLHVGKTKEAYELASASAQRSGTSVPLAGWVAGLVAWGNGDYNDAAKYFEHPAKSKYASSWTAAAGAFWAARSNMRSGKTSKAKTWLRDAMQHPRTFYGLVATRAMSRGFDFNWDFPSFTEAHNEMLLNTPQGARAMALVTAGQIHLAESELLRLNPKTPDMQEALLAYAGHAGLPALALRAGSAFEGPNGQYYDAALYPKGNWKPRDQYRVDPDLVHAIMRQESKFDSRAESSSGALGLMQLMPRTASYIAGQKHLKSRTGQEQLLEPQTNLDIGEKYIVNLLKNKYVDGDIISMLIAYNAGPGNLKRWQKQWNGISDPLLFIELIPSRQTRAYVERVLANYWIYRFREGLSTPTLDAIAKGKNAYYADAQGAKKAPQRNPYKIAHNP